ncbi:hypothetical protein H9L15_15205 [Sphingomonas daechungensis]|uniref:Uncharacterized protein n=1 Tax=Sphingomonas daechungensis TaxID=1176646 RepID=A0ABX6T1Z2_9SPHN|nr:hypothetical protein [Sphingomonas daechungensis]QNP43243.1 hypothetical protein H9L15_15205 [Sphingomonas daechungensis]
MSASPQLSVIVGFSSDTIAPVARAGYLAECLGALAEQADPPTMEIIVAHHEPIEGSMRSRRAFRTFVSFRRQTS